MTGSIVTPTYGWRDDTAVGFGMVPTWVIRHLELKDVDVRLYALMAAKAFTDGAHKAPQAELAAEMGVHPSTVRRALERLNGRALDVVPTRTEAGDQGANVYRLYWSDPSANLQKRVVTDDQTPLHVRADRVSTDEHPSLQSERPSSHTTTSPADLQPVVVPDALEQIVRAWCEVTGQTATRAVLRKDIAKLGEYMKAGGTVPNRDEMVRMREDGIRDIGGWARVTYLGEQATISADLWDHVDERSIG